LTFPVRPTTVWRPGEEVTLKDVVTIPAGVRPGVYRLKVAMVEPERPTARIQLAIGGGDNEGACDLCPISAETHAAGPAVMYEEGFDPSSTVAPHFCGPGVKFPGFFKGQRVSGSNSWCHVWCRTVDIMRN
jgi:hypothetical protein